MFLKHDDHPSLTDLSLSVRTSLDWKPGVLKDFEFPLDITTIAFDPVSHLLAIGTARGVIHLRGGPGVATRFSLPKGIPVRFLQFGLLTERLVCLDGDHYLHVWDLTQLGTPGHVAMVRWDPTAFMILSPSYSHIFIALIKGGIRTYDLACMRKSSYTLPNLWYLHEEQVLKSGISPTVPPQNPECQVIELLPHPQNLGLLFVAYQDGVLLLDLKERKTIRKFELILPSGAPGGAGYGSQDILLPRRSSVTCITIHPAGHFFATGYIDGTIAFWSLDGSEQPILVRTLDDLDVNLVDTDMLEAQLSNVTPTNPLSREPIFKLSWSGFVNSKDPRGGETTLTVLGGTKPDKGPGLNVLLFPAFNPGEPPTPSRFSDQEGLHPSMVTAIRQSLREINSFFYSTNAPIQDFYLIPREDPHYNNTFDPQAILIVVEAGDDDRVLQAREFPPRIFTSTSQLRPENVSPPEDHLNDLGVTLESLSLPDHPESAGLPYEFSGTNFMATGYKIHVVGKEVYLNIVNSVDSSIKKPSVKLSAGCAFVDPSLEVRRDKYSSHRVLVCPNRDLTVSFYDFSSQLLQATSGTSLLHDFPESIDSLEIDLKPALDVIDNDSSPHDVYESSRSIIAAHFSPLTLECGVALNTGELLVYRPRSVPAAQLASEAHDEELKVLTNVVVEPWRKLTPYFALTRAEGAPIQCVAISDIGFIATSLTDGSLYVIDLRGPSLLHRPAKPARRSSVSSKHSTFSFHHTTEADAIISLTWTISGIDKDPKPSVRLIALRSSGSMEVYTISHSSSRTGFSFEGPVLQNKLIPSPLPEGTFIIDGKTGAPCKADQSRFADILHNHTQDGELVILVTSGTKGVRSFLNITGQRVGKAEWSSKHGDVIGVQIVERLGSRAFVAYTNESILHVYSLPELEHIDTISVHARPFRSINVDESGDFIGLDVRLSSQLVQSATYGTLFNFRRADAPPLLDLISNKKKIPPQPQPVSMGPSSFRSWFQFNQTMSGQEIDELLGGPNRPPPVERVRDAVSCKEEGIHGTSTISPFVASAAALQSDIYGRLTTALTERGQMLGGLEENFRSLEQGSKDMVSEAKRLAAQNSAKSWFGF